MSSLSNDSKMNLALVKKLSLASFADYPILGQLTFCQAILESHLSGQPSQLAMKYNNLFGIKTKEGGQGGTKGSILLQTTEYAGDGESQVMQRFDWNSNIEDSIEQHKNLLEGLSRYQNLKTATTFEEAAVMIREDGYATDPMYSNMLIQLYKQYF